MTDVIYVERILTGKVVTTKVQGLVRASDKLIGAVSNPEIRGVAELG